MRMFYVARVNSRSGSGAHARHFAAAMARHCDVVELIESSAPASAPANDRAGRAGNTWRWLRLARACWVEARLALRLLARQPSRDDRAVLRSAPCQVSALLLLVLRRPYLVEANALTANEVAGVMALPRIVRLWEVFVWRRAEAVMCVSRAVVRQALDAGVAPDRARWLPNGGPEPLPAVPRRDRPSVVYLASFQPFHCEPRFLAAVLAGVAARTGAEILLVGDGPLRPSVEQAIDELGQSERRVSTGWVSPDEIQPLLAKASVAVVVPSPADDFYYSPLKMFEYLAAGLPVVAAPLGDVEDLAAGSPAIELVHSNAEADWIEAIVALLRDDEERTTRSSAALKLAARHTWDRRARDVLEVLHG